MNFHIGDKFKFASHGMTDIAELVAFEINVLNINAGKYILKSKHVGTDTISRSQLETLNLVMCPNCKHRTELELWPDPTYTQFHCVECNHKFNEH